jgi:hypothetical protein
MVFFDLQKCNSKERECYSDEKIDSILTRGYFNAYFPQFDVDP